MLQCLENCLQAFKGPHYYSHKTAELYDLYVTVPKKLLIDLIVHTSIDLKRDK